MTAKRKLEKNPFPVKFYEGTILELRKRSISEGRSINNIIRNAVDKESEAIILDKDQTKLLHDLLFDKITTTAVASEEFAAICELQVRFRTPLSSK
jgi:hypothetical protein